MTSFKVPPDCIQVSLSLDRNVLSSITNQNLELFIMNSLLSQCMGTLNFSVSNPKEQPVSSENSNIENLTLGNCPTINHQIPECTTNVNTVSCESSNKVHTIVDASEAPPINLSENDIYQGQRATPCKRKGVPGLKCPVRRKICPTETSEISNLITVPSLDLSNKIIIRQSPTCQPFSESCPVLINSSAPAFQKDNRANFKCPKVLSCVTVNELPKEAPPIIDLSPESGLNSFSVSRNPEGPSIVSDGNSSSDCSSNSKLSPPALNTNGFALEMKNTNNTNVTRFNNDFCVSLFQNAGDDFNLSMNTSTSNSAINDCPISDIGDELRALFPDEDENEVTTNGVKVEYLEETESNNTKLDGAYNSQDRMCFLYNDIPTSEYEDGGTSLAVEEPETQHQDNDDNAGIPTKTNDTLSTPGYRLITPRPKNEPRILPGERPNRGAGSGQMPKKRQNRVRIHCSLCTYNSDRGANVVRHYVLVHKLPDPVAKLVVKGLRANALGGSNTSSSSPLTQKSTSDINCSPATATSLNTTSQTSKCEVSIT